MNLWDQIKRRWLRPEPPIHLKRGRLGERLAKRHLQRRGLKFLTANFTSKRGEIDLIFRDADCLVFVEVKTRSAGQWTRPAAAVNLKKRRLLTRAALDYLKRIKQPPVRVRFDVVEVLIHGHGAREIRHLPNSFAMVAPYRYG